MSKSTRNNEMAPPARQNLALRVKRTPLSASTDRNLRKKAVNKNNRLQTLQDSDNGNDNNGNDVHQFNPSTTSASATTLYEDGDYPYRRGDRRFKTTRVPTRRQRKMPKLLPPEASPIESTVGLMLPGAKLLREPKVLPSPRRLSEAPPTVAFDVRKYFNMLFGSVLIEAQLLLMHDTVDICHAIPGVVADILRFNNIQFDKIQLVMPSPEMRYLLFEPIEFSIDQHNSTLNLYLGKALYDEYCRRTTKPQVVFTNGALVLEQFNPLAVSDDLGIIDMPVIRCAVLCDHVAQHIIDEMLNRNNPNRSLTDDVHDHWTNLGTTAHSMFRIERMCSRLPKEMVKYNVSPAMTVANANNRQPQYNKFTTPEASLYGTNCGIPGYANLPNTTAAPLVFPPRFEYQQQQQPQYYHQPQPTSMYYNSNPIY